MDLFAKSVEYVNGYCYVDGVLQANNDSCTVVGAISAIVLIPLVLVGLALFVWWIMTLVHVLSHPDVPNRVLWIVLHFIGLSTLAAPVYYFAVQRPYSKSKGSQSAPASKPAETKTN